MKNSLPRTMALWIPDWPIHAFRAEIAESARTGPPLGPVAPTALVAQQRVVACSSEARAGGVRVGQRVRDAQSLCPQLDIHPHDPSADERRFAHVLAAIEEVVPGVDPILPGLCAVRARGPSRYFGSEARAAAELLALTNRLGYGETRIGVARGKFAAEHAARAAPQAPGLVVQAAHIHVLPDEHTTRFLAALPIASACTPDLAATLHGLGIPTLGAFAALPEAAVRERFGVPGVRAHRLARGLPASGTSLTAHDDVTPRTPPPDFTADLDLEPPIDGADQLAFACSALADEFTESLAAAGLVCTELRIELTDDTGVRHERDWAHPRRFDGPDVLNRIRWQAAAVPRDSGRGGAGIAGVRLTPIRIDRAASHEPGLWSDEPDTRVHHHLQRVQSRIGHEGVATAELTGGRLSHERVRFIPWGTRTAGLSQRTRLREGPWPGQLLPPLPSTVFPTPIAASLTDTANETVRIDDSDMLASRPHLLRVAEPKQQGRVTAWSEPWPLRERWWTRRPARFRLQLLLESGDAWLLIREGDRWFAEGRYD